MNSAVGSGTRAAAQLWPWTELVCRTEANKFPFSSEYLCNWKGECQKTHAEILLSRTEY